eukprot:1232734-Amphidinium_carterae.1
MESSVAGPDQPASSVDTHRQLALEFVAPEALVEEPPGSSSVGLVAAARQDDSIPKVARGQ